MSGGGGFADPNSWHQALSGDTYTDTTAVNSHAVQSGTSTTSGNQQVDTLSPQDQQQLGQVIQGLLGNAQGFSKDQAIKDSGDLQAQAIQTLRESVLPGISAAQTKSGGYNSTTNAMLQDDAVSRSATDLAALRLQTIAQYATVQQNDINSAINAVNTLKGATTKTSGTSTTESNTTTDTQSLTSDEKVKEGIFGKTGFLGLGH